MRRIQATTSCEEGFEGLSRLITPVLLVVCAALVEGRSTRRGAEPSSLDVRSEVSFERGAAGGDGGEVSACCVDGSAPIPIPNPKRYESPQKLTTNEQFIVILEQEGPLGSVESRGDRFGFDGEAVVIVSKD